MKPHDLQNSDLSINRLAAARELYSTSKFYNNFYLTMNVFVTFCFAFISLLLSLEVVSSFLNLPNINLASWVAVYSIAIMTFDKVFIVRAIDSTRELAAKIQEQFDRSLYGLEWNYFLTGDEPRAELVNHYGSIYIRNNQYHSLYNWYPETLSEISTPKLALICQSSSLGWDVSLREKINIALLLLALFLFVAALTACIYFDLTVSIAAIYVASLSGPTIEYIYTSYRSNLASINNSKKLINLVTNIVDEAANGATDERLIYLVEMIQSQIFIKRKTDWLIPDIFYKFFKTNFENNMIFSAGEIEKKLK